MGFAWLLVKVLNGNLAPGLSERGFWFLLSKQDFKEPLGLSAESRNWELNYGVFEAFTDLFGSGYGIEVC